MELAITEKDLTVLINLVLNCNVKGSDAQYIVELLRKLEDGNSKTDNKP